MVTLFLPAVPKQQTQVWPSEFDKLRHAGSIQREIKGKTGTLLQAHLRTVFPWCHLPFCDIVLLTKRSILKICRCIFQNSATLPGNLQACPVADLPTPLPSRASIAPIIFCYLCFLLWITNFPRAQWHHLLPLHLEFEPQIAFESLRDYWNYSMKSFKWLQITAMTGGPCCWGRCQHWASRCSHPLGMLWTHLQLQLCRRTI